MRGEGQKEYMRGGGGGGGANTRRGENALSIYLNSKGTRFDQVGEYNYTTPHPKINQSIHTCLYCVIINILYKSIHVSVFLVVT